MNQFNFSTAFIQKVTDLMIAMIRLLQGLYSSAIYVSYSAAFGLI